MTEEEARRELIRMELQLYEAAVEPWFRRLREIAARRPAYPLFLTKEEAARLCWIEGQPPC